MEDRLAAYRRAAELFDAGDPIRAARILEPIVAAEPANAGARLLLARSYFSSAQLNRAEAQLRSLVERDPTDHYALFVLGRTLERLGRPAEAVQHLRVASVMHPNADYQQALERVLERVRSQPL